VRVFSPRAPVTANIIVVFLQLFVIREQFPFILLTYVGVNMSIALVITDRNVTTLYTRLTERLPNVNIQCWPNISAPENVEFVVAWQAPDNIWQQFPKIKAISSLGAGCDTLTKNPNIAAATRIVRIVDIGLAEQMAEYVLASILLVKRRFIDYFQQQQSHQWKTLKKIKGKKVTVLGIGKIGHHVATSLTACGYNVTGWSQHQKQHNLYQTFYGMEQLKQAVNKADFIVVTLPLTSKTQQILSSSLFKAIDNQAWLINVGRGELLNEQDLLSALTNNYLAGAVLDVFSEEPLVSTHPFWQHKNIIITPHISAISDQAVIVEQIADNYERLQANRPLENVVNKEQEY